MVLFRITENEPSKMHNVRPYVYSRPWNSIVYKYLGITIHKNGSFKPTVDDLSYNAIKAIYAMNRTLDVSFSSIKTAINQPYPTIWM